LNANALAMEGITGTVNISRNVFKDVSSCYATAINLTPEISPKNIYVEDNVAFNNAGIKFFSAGTLLSSSNINSSFIKSTGAALFQTSGSQLVGAPTSGAITYNTISSGFGFPASAGNAWTYNRSTYQGCYSIFKENSASSSLWVQSYDSSGVGQGWINITGIATTTVKGLVNQSTVATIESSAKAVVTSAPVATDEATAISLVNDLKAKYDDSVVLINELKAQLIAALTSDRTSGRDKVN
ncbi:MAG: hypothetical protein ACRDE7_04270, partial [Sphingobacterium sp.]